MNILTPNSKDLRPHKFKKRMVAVLILFGMAYTTDDTDPMTLLLLI